MKCQLCDDKADFICRCKTAYCCFCGMQQGPFTNKYKWCTQCKSFLNHLPKNEWSEFFSDNFEMLKKIETQIQDDAVIYPSPENVFKAFELCQPSEIKVVIIGQDCYHGPDQAMGLSFSVNDGIHPPPSLKNIFKELENDGFAIKNKYNGNLTKWAKQGVFLFNTALTVKHKTPGSHLKIWKPFADQVIKYINFNCSEVVFVLWGNFAKQCKSMIGSSHHVIESAHPSPFSAHDGFFGSSPFKKINQKLENPIDWNL